jgi:hypothetical protein
MYKDMYTNSVLRHGIQLSKYNIHTSHEADLYTKPLKSPEREREYRRANSRYLHVGWSFSLIYRRAPFSGTAFSLGRRCIRYGMGSVAHAPCHKKLNPRYKESALSLFLRGSWHGFTRVAALNPHTDEYLVLYDQHTTA